MSTSSSSTPTGKGGAAAAAGGSPSGYSRKQKSLGLLCDRFIEQFSNSNASDSDEILINLDTTSQHLQVERRRIYDIVNILESIQMVVRQGKNVYIWRGHSEVADTLRDLKEAVDSGRAEVIDGVRLDEVSHVLLPDYPHSSHADSQKPAAGANRLDSPSASTSFSSTVKQAFQHLPQSVSDDSNTPRKRRANTASTTSEQSLGHLSTLFIQLFFATPLRILSLDDASNILMQAIQRRPWLTQSLAEAALKSKVRRLYDIANVLVSIRLIEKVHIVHTRKNAFRWRGAGVFPLQSSVGERYANVDTPTKNVVTPGSGRKRAFEDSHASYSEASSSTIATGLKLQPTTQMAHAAAVTPASTRQSVASAATNTQQPIAGHADESMDSDMLPHLPLYQPVKVEDASSTHSPRSSAASAHPPAAGPLRATGQTGLAVAYHGTTVNVSDLHQPKPAPQRQSRRHQQAANSNAAVLPCTSAADYNLLRQTEGYISDSKSFLQLYSQVTNHWLNTLVVNSNVTAV